MNRWSKSGSLKKPVATNCETSKAKDEEVLVCTSVTPDVLISPGVDSEIHGASQELLNKQSVDKAQQGVMVKSRSTRRKRKYCESYIDLGFTETSEGQPQCVICSKVLPNSSMFPAKLRRHFEGTHSDYKNKTTNFFKRKRTELSAAQKTILTHAKTINENALKASYMVSYRVALAGEAHTIAESLIKSCISDVVNCVLDERARKLIASVPLSNNTITRRIQDLANDVKENLISRMKCRKFSIQMDESTDIAGLAIFLVIVRYQGSESFEEDLLLCKPLPSNTTGNEIFNLLDKFFSENGAKSMTGHTAGAVARIKKKSKQCSSSHCVLHTQALAMKQMPPSLKKVLDEAIQIINYIKSRPLKSRLFKILCDDMGSLHQSLLLHTEVSWLSRGKALTRLFELNSEVRSFLMDHNIQLATILSEEHWLWKLSYLADIFGKLNEMNLSLQGKSLTVFNAHDRVRSFKESSNFGSNQLRKITLSVPLMKEFQEEHQSNVPLTVLGDISEHLQRLRDSFMKYFPTAQEVKLEEYKWVINPFEVHTKPFNLTSSEYECLIDMTSDTVLKDAFSNTSISEFWINLNQEFKPLVDKILPILLPFSTTYLCESGFSAYVATKTKYRNRLDAEPDIRLQLIM